MLRECEICFTQQDEEEFIKLRCKHTLCISCKRKIMNHKCPFCRDPFESNTSHNPTENYNNITIVDHRFEINDDLDLLINDYAEERIIRQIDRRFRRRQARERRYRNMEIRENRNINRANSTRQIQIRQLERENERLRDQIQRISNPDDKIDNKIDNKNDNKNDNKKNKKDKKDKKDKKNRKNNHWNDKNRQNDLKL